MAYYAVGDIQGCYDPLAKLLDQVNFDTNKDTLLCVGDLVNRGPKSLKVLRFLRKLGDNCQCVLGNHDIHLLSMIYGIRQPRTNDTLLKTLEAHDVDEIATWLRHIPLLHIDNQLGVVMCHAGIYPWWSLQEAQEYASEMHRIFVNEKKMLKFLKRMYGNTPTKWQPDLGKVQRQRFIVNAFTRMRFCSPQGHLNLTESGFKGKIRKNRLPWFHFNNKSLSDFRVIFGHWSALGLMNTERFLSLDTGYVWGREMTLARLPEQSDKIVKLYSQAA